MIFKQYNPKSIIVNLGEILMQGFAKGSMVKVEYDEDAVKKTVGAQGDVTATISQNRAGKATLRFKQVSPVNDQLSAIAASNRPRESPLLIKPFQVLDLGGSTIAIAPFAWVLKVAESEFGEEEGEREWVIDFAELKMKTGGATR